MPHVILIEADALVRKLLEKRLLAANWTVTALSNTNNLILTIWAEKPDLIILEFTPQAVGIGPLATIRSLGMNTPVIVVTSFDITLLDESLLGNVANEVIQKPYDQEDLLQRMQGLIAA
ncbi:MAG: response regulator [Flavobacteriales bacterium]|nr:response regulator [Flavobacteriales bacterium]